MAKTVLPPAAALPASTDGFAPTRPLGAAAKGQKLPNFGDRSRRFMLGAHYSSWELFETSRGWRLVPTLKPLFLQAGVNWTPAAKPGQPLDSSHLEAKARTRFSFQMLTDLENYLVEVDGDGAPGIFLRWERVKTYADGKWSVETDQDGYALWRWSLVTTGRVEPPRDDILADMRRRLRNAVNRATRTPHLAQAQEAKAEAERRLAGLEQAVAALRDPKQHRPLPDLDAEARIRALEEELTALRTRKEAA